MTLRFSVLLLAGALLLSCYNSSGNTDTPAPPVSTGFCQVRDGVLYGPDGREILLWGVNFQTPLSWEVNRLAKAGVERSGAALNAVTDRNLDDVQKLGATLLRCHLTPADFTDSEGHLVQTAYLDALDHLVAEAGKRNLFLCFAFLNHMGQDGPGKAWAGKGSRTWIHDPAVVQCTKTYIRALLERTNPYNGIPYKDNPSIAFWELINEPEMYDREALRSTPYAQAYDDWLAAKKTGDSEKAYAQYREETVREYVDGMVDLLRACGDAHPVCWGLNWHRFRRGNADIFAGIAASKANLVAFCNYPGQDDVARDYSNYRYDFTGKSFTDWFNRYSTLKDGYGWTLDPEFAGKAVTVYEFETFFNQSAWMYPVQALLFRSHRAQAATMWTYTFAEIACASGGSHYLNLRTTPGKAASFMVARKIFENTPSAQKVTFADEMAGEGWCISREHNAAVYSDASWYCTSGETASGWSGITPSPTVRHIRGVGNSPLVSYGGNGLYFIDETDEGLSVELMPDVTVVGDPFAKGDGVTPVTELDSTVPHPVSILLERWKERASAVYSIQDGQKVFVKTIKGTQALTLAPGRYLIVAQ